MAPGPEGPSLPASRGQRCHTSSSSQLSVDEPAVDEPPLPATATAAVAMAMLAPRARPLLSLRPLCRPRRFAASARAPEEAAGEWVATPVPHRSVYRVKGRDTYKLLQGLVTNNVQRIEDLSHSLALARTSKEPIQMDALYAGLLTPQGRMVADLFLYPEAAAEPSVLIDLDRRVASEALALINKFKLRSKCVIEELPDYKAGQVFFIPPMPKGLRDYYVGGAGATTIPLWDESHTPPLWYQVFATASVGLPPPEESSVGSTLMVAGRDPRSEGMQFRFLADTARVQMPSPFTQPGRAEELYTLHRIWQGVGEGIDDMVPDSSIPLEVNLDYMNGGKSRTGPAPLNMLERTLTQSQSTSVKAVTLVKNSPRAHTTEGSCANDWCRPCLSLKATRRNPGPRSGSA